MIWISYIDNHTNTYINYLFMFLPNTLWVGVWTHKHLLSFGLFQIPILTMYLEDFGCLGNIPQILQIRHERYFVSSNGTEFMETETNFAGKIHRHRLLQCLVRRKNTPKAPTNPLKRWKTDGCNTGGWRRKQQARGDMYILIMYI